MKFERFSFIKYLLTILEIHSILLLGDKNNYLKKDCVSNSKNQFQLDFILLRMYLVDDQKYANSELVFKSRKLNCKITFYLSCGAKMYLNSPGIYDNFSVIKIDLTHNK